MSPKGILSGSIAFIALVGLSGLYTTQYGSESLNWFVLTLLWIIPGYITASVAGKAGVLNASIVGVVIGILSGIITSLLTTTPAGVESSGGIEAGTVIGSIAVILCGFGGLVWHLKQSFAPQ